MKASAKYKAISVTVPSEMEKALEEVWRKEIRKKSEVVTEALRMYFRARGGKAQLWSLVMATVPPPQGGPGDVPVSQSARSRAPGARRGAAREDHDAERCAHRA